MRDKGRLILYAYIETIRRINLGFPY
jgi:hypothetical protein